jgi:hypothetical protein
MAVSADRKVTIEYDGSVEGVQVLEAAENAASPGSITVQSLASGFNSVSVPTSTGVTVTCVTIVPPTGNTTSITLKGVTGDTGIRIHNTDPTSLAIHSDVTAIGLTAGGIIQAVRFYWS